MKNELEIQASGGEAEETAVPAEAEGSNEAADCDGAAQLDAGESVETGESTEETTIVAEVVNADDFVTERAFVDTDRNELKAVIEAVIYITDEPLTPQQIAAALNRPMDIVKELLDELTADYARPERGLNIREIAGGFKMATKPEHHEAVRSFVKALKPALKLSLAALETLAVIAYKQPVTGPEIMEIRGVQGLGVLKTLIDRKLIATAGRKNVVGKPILYKTTKDFLVQFGLKDLSELPTLKEFEELGRLALSEGEEAVIPEDTVTLEEAASAESQAPVEAVEHALPEAADTPAAEASPETEPEPEHPAEPNA